MALRHFSASVSSVIVIYHREHLHLHPCIHYYKKITSLIVPVDTGHHSPFCTVLGISDMISCSLYLQQTDLILILSRFVLPLFRFPLSFPVTGPRSGVFDSNNKSEVFKHFQAVAPPPFLPVKPQGLRDGGLRGERVEDVQFEKHCPCGQGYRGEAATGILRTIQNLWNTTGTDCVTVFSIT